MYSIIPDPNLEVQPQQSKLPGPFSPHYRFFVFPVRRFLLTCMSPLNHRLCVQTQQTRASYLLLALRSAWPLPPSPLHWGNTCTRPMHHLCQHLHLSKGLILFIYFIAAELSWSCAEEQNVHTHPPSHGGEEEEGAAEGSPTPVSNRGIWITLLTQTPIFVLYFTFNFNRSKISSF